MNQNQWRVGRKEERREEIVTSSLSYDEWTVKAEAALAQREAEHVLIKKVSSFDTLRTNQNVVKLCQHHDLLQCQFSEIAYTGHTR